MSGVPSMDSFSTMTELEKASLVIALIRRLGGTVEFTSRELADAHDAARGTAICAQRSDDLDRTVLVDLRQTIRGDS